MSRKTDHPKSIYLKMVSFAKRPFVQAGLRNLGHSAKVLWMTLLLVLVLGSTVFAGSVVHTVQPGESLTSIARKYRVTTSQILRENSIANANVLRVGQVLTITLPDESPAPTSTPVPTSTPAPTSAPGDSTEPPATPTAEEQDAVQPTKTPTPPPTATPQPVSSGCNRYTQAGDLRYTIRSGDSLYGLASRYGASVGAIKSRNCMTSDVVVVGQLLIIPMAVVPADATPAATATPRSASTSPATFTPTPWPTVTPRPAPTATPVPAPTADNRSWLDKLLNR